MYLSLMTAKKMRMVHNDMALRQSVYDSPHPSSALIKAVSIYHAYSKLMIQSTSPQVFFLDTKALSASESVSAC